MQLVDVLRGKAVQLVGIKKILLGVAAAPLIGTTLLFVGIPAYFVTLLLRRSTYPESKAILWIVTYLGGLGLISYLGDQFFIYDNFLQPSQGYPITVQPIGIITTPYDLVVLVAFALAMFFWGFYSAVPRGRARPELASDRSPGTPAETLPTVGTP